MTTPARSRTPIFTALNGAALQGTIGRGNPPTFPPPGDVRRPPQGVLGHQTVDFTTTPTTVYNGGTFQNPFPPTGMPSGQTVDFTQTPPGVTNGTTFMPGTYMNFDDFRRNQTGYQGQFGGGAFNAWAGANGFNPTNIRTGYNEYLRPYGVQAAWAAPRSGALTGVGGY